MLQLNTSDYRGYSTNMTSNVPASSSGNHTQQIPTSYAKATEKQPATIFPKKDQAIVLNVQDDLKLADYIVAIGNIVQPKNIQFASRISNDRVCIYLSDIQHVNKLVDDTKVIKIGDHNLNIRRLITPARRIILSNVCPSVPHYVVERALRGLGIEPLSPITFLRATFIGNEYSHVMSFRRQLYIKPDNNLQLPPSMLLNFEDTPYRIFICYDEIVCFLCKDKGHIAKQCPKSEQLQTQESQTDMNQEHTESDNADSHLPPSELLSQINESQNPPSAEIGCIENPLKRTATSLETVSTDQLIQLDEMSDSSQKHTSTTDQTFAVPDQKIRNPRKLRKQNSVEVDPLQLNEMLEPVKSVYQECNPSIPFDIFSFFLENAFGNPDPLSLARTYKLNVSELVQTLGTIHPHITTRSLKNRCTRLRKKLRSQTNNEVSDSETDASQVSSY